ncbi:hypothetical protein AVO52_18060 [Vibrio cholerae]|nr:hypothetical protein AVO52_18060 [Vibrio cholerae]
MQFAGQNINMDISGKKNYLKGNFRDLHHLMQKKFQLKQAQELRTKTNTIKCAIIECTIVSKQHKINTTCL